MDTQGKGCLDRGTEGREASGPWQALAVGRGCDVEKGTSPSDWCPSPCSSPQLHAPPVSPTPGSLMLGVRLDPVLGVGLRAGLAGLGRAGLAWKSFQKVLRQPW